MFDDIPESILNRMSELESMDSADRADGTPRMERLRQVPPDTGRFIALLAASSPRGRLVEIGTSAGYSTLWLSLAANATGRRITTFEILPEKAALARETFDQAGVAEYVDFVEGDALDHLAEIKDIAFCFLDAEKEVYAECYDLVVPSLVKGGLLVADNAISHQETLQPTIDLAITDPRLDALVVPIGTGELVCRRV